MNATFKRRISPSEGFSMIEILVVLVLLSLLTVMAAPSLSAYVDRTKTRRALDRLVADVNYARVLSVQQGRRTSVSIGSGGTYTISTLADNGTWSVVKTEYLGTAFPGIVVSGGSTTLQFTSRGMLDSSATVDGFIKIARGGLRDSIFVSPAGRVYRAY